MKIIFLDIDGVLNANDDFGGRKKPNPHCDGWAGISTAKVKRLKEIIDATGAKVVLVSSWKYDYVNYLRTRDSRIGKYLRNKLKKQGITIYDTTFKYDTTCGKYRGYEIASWITDCKELIERWILLDDCEFIDYKNYNIISHWVKTTEEFGLTEQKVAEAIYLLS